MSIKRINNELKNIKNYLNINNLNISFRKNNERYLLTLFQNNQLIMNIDIPKDYPFHPYNFTLSKKYNYINVNNTINYNKWLSNIKIIKNKYHILFMTNLIGHYSDCLCCSSITCTGKWCPSLTIEKGIIEYKNFLIYKLYSTPLMIRYLEKLYNNLFPKLSDDLKEKIFSYCLYK